jgi:protein SCO1/2
MRTRLLVFIVAGFLIGALTAAAVLLLTAPDGTRQVQSSGTALVGGPFSLIGADGKTVTDQDFRGRYMLVFFGFTHCPDVCPTTLAKLSQVVKAANLPELKVLLVSVDPERDTPEQLERYVHAFNPDFKAVTGKQEEIERIAREFGVAVVKVNLAGGDYTVDHSAVVFLLNDQAQRVALFTPPLEIEPIAADLRAVADKLRG